MTELLFNNYCVQILLMLTYSQFNFLAFTPEKKKKANSIVGSYLISVKFAGGIMKNAVYQKDKERE